MSNIIIILILLAIAAVSVKSTLKRYKNGCCGGGCSTVKIKPNNSNISHYSHKTTVYIDGMSCENCKIRIENAFNTLSECYAKVQLKKKYAEIWSNCELSDKYISDIIENLGFTFVKCIR